MICTEECFPRLKLPTNLVSFASLVASPIVRNMKATKLDCCLRLELWNCA